MEPCPNCREPRIGAFRYCRLCGFDFDASDPAPTAVDAPEEPFVPFALFPAQSADDVARGDDAGDDPGRRPWSTVSFSTGFMVIVGILLVFVALIVVRPLG
ncbi:MAG: hypothetical protein ACRDIL_18850 [Candidatus Limnocylindrales bacterium]